MKPYYQDNAVTIYHSDCREILPHLEPVDLVLTDPPYGVGFSYNGQIDFDVSWIPDFITSYGGAKLVTPGIRNVSLWPKADWILGWFKPGSTRRSDLGGFNTWEPILMYGKSREYQDSIYLPDCANHEETGHPCPKPLKLFLWLANIFEGTILDPFMGSGTTLRAAKDLSRKAIGIDIEEKYCEIAAKRMSQEVLDLSFNQEQQCPPTARLY